MERPDRDADAISESANTETAATGEGRILGTPGYMSPEQGKGREIDARSDLFSFGVLYYEMLTRRRPFSGKTVMETIIAADRDRHEPVTGVNPALPEEVNAVVDRCLAKRPEDRPESAALLLGALRSLRETKRGPNLLEGRAKETPAAQAVSSLLATTGSIRRASTADGGSARRRGRWVLVALGLVVALAATIFEWRRLSSSGFHGVSSGAPSSSVSAAPTAITDLALPHSDNPEALKFYSVGLQAIRDSDEDAAIRALEKCRTFEESVRQTRLEVTLGGVFEEKGDKSKACAAYAVVLRRWARARPKSVTLEAARTRAQALHCPE